MVVRDFLTYNFHCVTTTNTLVDFQIMSNGEYKSVDHRVLANPKREARVAIAVFFNPSNTEDTYGPLSEMVSPEKPALYQQFTLSELMQRFFNKGLDGKALVNHFRL